MIDQSARVDPGASIGRDVAIGPYCVIGPNVVLGDGCRLVAHVHLAGHTTVGARTTIYPFASLGTPPQSVHYKDEPTRLTIGADCVIREGVTMNVGTPGGGGHTQVGDRGFFMAQSHVAHDCRVGADVTMANAATLGGHVTVGAHSFIGGLSAVHQHVRVGEGAMIGGCERVRRDVIPFGLVMEDALRGLNFVGLKRRGCGKADLRRLQAAYRVLFFGEGTIDLRVGDVARDFVDDPRVAAIVAFLLEGGRRHLTLPHAPGAAGTADDS